MILYKEETVRTPIQVLVQYPAYYQGCVYSSHYVAVLSDTQAVQLCVAAQHVQVQQTTPAEAFRFPPFEDYEPVGEEEFREALRRVQEHVGGMLAERQPVACG
jgi:hypothetical protein